MGRGEEGVGCGEVGRERRGWGVVRWGGRGGGGVSEVGRERRGGLG